MKMKAAYINHDIDMSWLWAKNVKFAVLFSILVSYRLIIPPQLHHFYHGFAFPRKKVKIMCRCKSRNVGRRMMLC